MNDDNTHLMFAISLNENCPVYFAFRWGIEFSKWWSCNSETKSAPFATREFPKLKSNVLIFGTSKSSNCLSETEYLNMYGAETNFRCEKHNIACL